MDGIHALGASVSMATGGAKAVDGGNFQVFEQMIEDSKAILHLTTEVCSYQKSFWNTDPRLLGEGYRSR